MSQQEKTQDKTMKAIKHLLIILFLLSVLPNTQASQEREVLPRSQSPNGKYGIVFASKEQKSEPQAQLINLETKQIVSNIPARKSSTEDTDYYVVWKTDSSAFIFVIGSRWGADKVFIVEIGNVTSITEITSCIRNLLEPSFEKSGAKPYNNYYNFIFDRETRTTFNKNRQITLDPDWVFDQNGSVKVNTICTNDPKQIYPTRWVVQFQGTWDEQIDGFKNVRITNK